MLLGLFLIVWLLPGPRSLGFAVLDVHTMLCGAAMVLIGFQSVSFAVLGKVFAMTSGLMPWSPKLRRVFDWITLETGLLCGGLLVAGGIAGLIVAVYIWNLHNFGPLNPQVTLRWVIPAVTAASLGFQIVLSSFFLSMLGLSRH